MLRSEEEIRKEIQWLKFSKEMTLSPFNSLFVRAKIEALRWVLCEI